MSRSFPRQWLEWTVMFFMAVAILWKGGKALDTVWLLAGVAAVVTLADAFLVRAGQRENPSRPPWITVIAYLAWTILSFTQSETKNYGFDELLQATSLALLFIFTLMIPRSQVAPFQSRLAKFIAVSALAACAVGIAVYCLQPVSRFVGTFFDTRFTTDYWPNAWAEFLLLAWPMAVWSLWGRQGRSGASFDLFRAASTGVLGACLLLSYSRGGMIAFVLQAVMLAAFAVWKWRMNLPWKRLIVITGITAMTALILFTGINGIRARYHTVQSVVDKVTFKSDEGTSSVDERQQFWRQARALTANKPVTGYGPYSFRFLQPHLQESVLATSDHAHNVFLKLSAERGLPGALLFLLLISIGVLSGIHRAVVEKDRSTSLLTALVTISVLGVLAHNMIDYNLQFVGIALPFWLLLGTLPRRGRSKLPQKFFTLVSAMIAALLLVFTFIEGRYLAFSYRARAAEVRGNFPEALRWYDKTDASIFPRDAWLARSAILIHGGTPDAAQAALDRAKALNPHDYRVWKLQGDLDLKNGDRGAALYDFEMAFEAGKYNDLGIMRVLIELLQNNRETLDDRRHGFELLLNDFGLAMQQNTHFIDLSSSVEELVKITDLLAKIYPAEAAEYRALGENVMTHALAERERLTSRPRGILW